MKSEEIIDALLKYIAEWRSLDRQYLQTPNWRMIKQFRILHQQHELTRVFTARMKLWGIIK